MRTPSLFEKVLLNSFLITVLMFFVALPATSLGLVSTSNSSAVVARHKQNQPSSVAGYKDDRSKVKVESQKVIDDYLNLGKKSVKESSQSSPSTTRVR